MAARFESLVHTRFALCLLAILIGLIAAAPAVASHVCPTVSCRRSHCADEGNRAPSVTASGPARASVGERLQLYACGEDPDGDRLSYAWSVTAGNARMVSFSGCNAANITSAMLLVQMSFKGTSVDGVIAD